MKLQKLRQDKSQEFRVLNHVRDNNQRGEDGIWQRNR